VGLVLASAIALAAWRLGSLSASGAAAATVAGTVAMGAGWDWGILLVTYFASSSLLTRFRAEDKAHLLSGRLDKGGVRDAVQVLANGGVFAGAAIGYLATGSPGWRLVAAGALAASAADTWATEIGTLSRAAPRSILTWRRVEAGTSGAVTGLGLIAGVGGAMLLGVTAAFIGWGASGFRAAIVGGFVGCVFDSVLGASLQARRWCAVCRAETEQPVHRCGAQTSLRGGVSWLDNALSTIVGALLGAAAAS
jgi:uncharacterized protein (TIGR00297 family)